MAEHDAAKAQESVVENDPRSIPSSKKWIGPRPRPPARDRSTRTGRSSPRLSTSSPFDGGPGSSGRQALIDSVIADLDKKTAPR